MCFNVKNEPSPKFVHFSGPLFHIFICLQFYPIIDFGTSDFYFFNTCQLFCGFLKCFRWEYLVNKINFSKSVSGSIKMKCTVTLNLKLIKENTLFAPASPVLRICVRQGRWDLVIFCRPYNRCWLNIWLILKKVAPWLIILLWFTNVVWRSYSFFCRCFSDLSIIVKSITIPAPTPMAYINISKGS